MLRPLNGGAIIIPVQGRGFINHGSTLRCFQLSSSESTSPHEPESELLEEDYIRDCIGDSYRVS